MSPSRTVAERLLLRIGSIGPLGHLPASGTVTVGVVGVPLYFVMHSWSLPIRLAVTILFTAAAVGLHEIGDRILQTKDSRRLVWDELAGFFIAVVMLPEFTWPLAALAFFLERGLDITKVPPANWIEKHWPGGWGVVGDDVVAGLYTGAVLLALVHFAPRVVGL